jgi:hypothetical protein
MSLVIVPAIWCLVGLSILGIQMWYCCGIRNFIDEAAGEKFTDGKYFSCREDYNSYSDHTTPIRKRDNKVPDAAFYPILLLNILVAAFFGPAQLLGFIGLSDRKDYKK